MIKLIKVSFGLSFITLVFVGVVFYFQGNDFEWDFDFDFDFGAESDLVLAGYDLVPLSVQNGSGDVYELEVAIAEDTEERRVGLQIAQFLSRDEGMWFVFDEQGVRNFWMKDMVISLDILFVNSDFEIISIAEDVPPCSEVDPQQLECPSYSSVEPAQFVLELQAGSVNRYNLSIGDLITL